MTSIIETTNGSPFFADDDFGSRPLMLHKKNGESTAVDVLSLSWKWVGTGSKRHVAAVIPQLGWLAYAHRLVMECPGSSQVDHVDGDTSNNRRANLRLATHSENLCNQRKPRHRATEYRGVRWSAKCVKRRFFVTIKKDGVQYRSRTFKTVVEAAQEHDRLAVLLYGQFAVLNFPQVKGSSCPTSTSN